PLTSTPVHSPPGVGASRSERCSSRRLVASPSTRHGHRFASSFLTLFDRLSHRICDTVGRPVFRVSRCIVLRLSHRSFVHPPTSSPYCMSSTACGLEDNSGGKK